MNRRRAIILALLAILALFTASLLYVAVPVGRDLQAARDLVDPAVSDLTTDQVEAALSKVGSASDRLHGRVSGALQLIPLVGANLGAVESTVDALSDVLEQARSVASTVAVAREKGLFEGGAFRWGTVDRLKEAVSAQLPSVHALVDGLKRDRSGRLAPPVWSALDDLLYKSDRVLRTLEKMDGLLSMADGLLGRAAPRTYAVLLLNNAELRGAGGILTALGTMTVDDGHIQLDKLLPADYFRNRPRRRVDAPEEFKRRYGRFLADTTLTVNTSYSPEIPDVAVVAANILETVTGAETSGALVVDPRGIASLMPADASFRAPGTTETVTPEDFSDFVYSKAYEAYDTRAERQTAVLRLGRKVLQASLGEGITDPDQLLEVGDAVAAGHVRFVSFDPREEEVLTDAGLSGAMPVPAPDGFMVASQNFGGGGRQGSKLDFWTKREIEDRCEISGDGHVGCTLRVALTNEVPDGLSTYVAGKPYGLLRSYVEIFVPRDAEVTRVLQDGDAVEFTPEDQGGFTSLGIFLQVPQGESTRLDVGYELTTGSGDASYSLKAVPQPLAADARIDLIVSVPPGWLVDGPTETDVPGVFHLIGDFDHTIEVTTHRDERTGIPAWWEKVKFWD